MKDLTTSGLSDSAPIAVGACQLWLRSTDFVDLRWLKDAIEHFDADERARADAFRRRKDWLSYTYAHALRREVVATVLSVDPRSVKFASTSSGSPVLIQPRDAPISASLSHTRGWVSVAVSDGRSLGVDVECVGKGRQPDSGVLGMLSSFERVYLSNLPAVDLPVAFLSTWVGKEAYAKARGLGFGLPLDSYSVVVDRVTQVVELRRADGDAEDWELGVWRPHADVLIALAQAAGETTG